MRVNMKMIGWITLMSSAFVSLAVAVDSDASAPGPQIAGKPASVEYPFLAAAVGNDVYVRSGKGLGYYHCGKVNTGDQVTVVEEVAGWAKILPLPENYSWIHKSYVKVSPQAPKVGSVTGDNVRVWAGSDFIEPLRSNSLQTRLNTGEIVELMDAGGAETGDYYKIKSPAGAYLWISSDLLKYVGPVKPAEPVAAPKPADEKPLTLEEKLGVTPETAVAETPKTEEAKPEDAQPAAEEQAAKPEEEVKPEPPKPVEPTKESLYLKQCRELTDNVSAELKKPVDEQNYSEFRQPLTAIMEDKDAGRAATYAKLLLERIDRYELAISVTQTLRQQDEQLAQLREQIDKAYETQVEKVRIVQEPPLYTGYVKPSFVYTGVGAQRRFLLTERAGRIVCYLIPAGPEIEGRLEQLSNLQIGVRGNIVSDPKALVTLVSVTEIITNP